MTFYEKCSPDVLPLKSKLSGKFQRFNAINRSIEMLKIVEFSKISIKIKNCKTFCKAQTANRLKKFIQSPPHQNKPYYVSETNFFKETFRNIQTFAFKVLQECSSWVSRNGAVQMFFLTPNRNMFAGKFVNWESFLAVFWEHIIFNFKRVEIRKMSEVFWAKLYCKMSDLFR